MEIFHVILDRSSFIFSLKVQGPSVYKQGATWTADDIYGARDETNALGLDGVDTMSWWCDQGGDRTAGKAFVGTLCSSYNTNINEKQSSAAGSGFVSINENSYSY